MGSRNCGYPRTPQQHPVGRPLHDPNQRLKPLPEHPGWTYWWTKWGGAIHKPFMEFTFPIINLTILDPTLRGRDRIKR